MALLHNACGVVETNTFFNLILYSFRFLVEIKHVFQFVVCIGKLNDKGM